MNIVVNYTSIKLIFKRAKLFFSGFPPFFLLGPRVIHVYACMFKIEFSVTGFDSLYTEFKFHAFCSSLTVNISSLNL